MILKGSQRGGSKQMAAHLLETHDNEHVAVHELRGFVSDDDLHAALHEMYAISRGTRAKQFMFSVSLNPPAHETVSIVEFEAAIDATEAKLGLQGQPRAVVFHEKDGRRHAHVVWSRIDPARMRAINMAHFKMKLRDVSRQLYMDHGWQMPRGLMNSKERDPRNYTPKQWEQAKRAKADPRALKGMFQECWAASDSRKAFAAAILSRGYTLARGDRRGHVAVDFRGEVYAISKWTGLKTKDIRAKLGDGHDLPTLDRAKAAIAARMTDMLREHVVKVETAHQKRAAALALQKAQIVQQQRKERADLEAAHAARRDRETHERASRLNRGCRGIWDRITGKHGRQKRENEREAESAAVRDRKEKDALIERQLGERQGFHILARSIKASHAREVADLHRDIAAYNRMGSGEELSLREQFAAAARKEEPAKRPRSGRDFDLDR